MAAASGHQRYPQCLITCTKQLSIALIIAVALEKLLLWNGGSLPALASAREAVCHDSGLKMGFHGTQAKWVSCTSGSSVKVQVPTNPALGRGLQDYLALPVEEYSILDPEWIQRCEILPNALA